MINEGNIGADLWTWDVDSARTSSSILDCGTQVDVIDISYFIEYKQGFRKPKSKKQLLKNVTFRLEGGDMCALMGPSGAGKSTLLDVIAGRKLDGILNGDILFNGQPRSPFFLRESAYVMQDDVHIATLTVRETLQYAASLRMDQELSLDERRSRVNNIIKMLGLEKCADRLVGNAMMKGISGGQMKRLSIGVEIINMPGLIFLDEPTSGLDSAIAYEVISKVAQLTQQNRTIVCTIHQPSTETFHLFNKVLLLSRGQTIFFGSVDEAVHYFCSLDLGFTFDSARNPADFIIDVAGGALTPSTRTSPVQANELSLIFMNSVYYRSPKDMQLPTSTEQKSYRRLLPTDSFRQFKVLTRRGWTATIRQKDTIRAQVVKNFVVGIMCGCIFWQQGRDVTTLMENKTFSSAAFNVSSILFFAMLYTVMNNLQAIPQLFDMKLLFLRERSAGAYFTLPYFLSSAIVNIPVIILSFTIFFNTTYWMIGFNVNPSDIFYFIINTLSTNFATFYFAQFLAAASPSPQVALGIFPITFLFLSNFAGFTILIPNVADGWKWATYISYPRWSYQGLMVNEFDHHNDSAAFFKEWGFNGYDKWNSIVILFGFIAAMCFAVFVALLPKKSKLVEHSKLKATGLRDTELEFLPTKPLLSVDSDLESELSINDIEEQTIKRLTKSRKSSMDVNFFRQSSGQVDLSRGCRLMFRNLDYEVMDAQNKNKKIKLLKQVNGRTQPGEMCALMGASGAGKSTLLDVLADRKSTGQISGEILFNGGPRTRALMKKSAYVMQDDVHIGAFTVRQTLEFASKLRMSEALTDVDRAARVTRIMNMLGLQEVGETIVGDSFVRGISGGQKKRLSIAVEIINFPDLIFLDEPTSGLDSNIAFECMSAVRNLADQNRTVICTIHQPSTEVFNMFDKLLLLADGRVIYFGPVNQAVKYFTNDPLSYSFHLGMNPADFVIAIAGGFIQPTKKTSSESEPVDYLTLAKYFNDSILNSMFKENIQTLIELDRAAGGGGDDQVVVPEYPTGFLWQCRVVFWRQVLKTLKQRRPVVVGFFRHIIVGLFYGAIYANLSPTQQQERISLLFFCIVFVVLGNQQNIPIIFDERLFFYREKGAKAHGTFPYWLTMSLINLPLIIVNSLTFSSIVYYMTGLRSGSGHFGFFYITVSLSNLVGLFFCQALSSITPNSQTAIAIFPGALFFLLAFAGFIVQLPTLPSYLRSWAPIISFARWSFQGLTLNEFENNCDALLPKTKQSPVACAKASESFLEKLDFDNFDKWNTIPILLANAAFFYVLSYIALRKINFEKR